MGIENLDYWIYGVKIFLKCMKAYEKLFKM